MSTRRKKNQEWEKEKIRNLEITQNPIKVKAKEIGWEAEAVAADKNSKVLRNRVLVIRLKPEA